MLNTFRLILSSDFEKMFKNIELIQKLHNFLKFKCKFNKETKPFANFQLFSFQDFINTTCKQLFIKKVIYF